MTELITLGDIVKKGRLKKGISALELSNLSGINIKTIYRIESSETIDPQFSTIVALLLVLRISLYEVMNTENVIDHKIKLIN